jgi:hypothetical protein
LASGAKTRQHNIFSKDSINVVFNKDSRCKLELREIVNQYLFIPFRVRNLCFYMENNPLGTFSRSDKNSTEFYEATVVFNQLKFRPGSNTECCNYKATSAVGNWPILYAFTVII